MDSAAFGSLHAQYCDRVDSASCNNPASITILLCCLASFSLPGRAFICFSLDLAYGTSEGESEKEKKGLPGFLYLPAAFIPTS